MHVPVSAPVSPVIRAGLSASRCHQRSPLCLPRLAVVRARLSASRCHQSWPLCLPLSSELASLLPAVIRAGLLSSRCHQSWPPFFPLSSDWSWPPFFPLSSDLASPLPAVPLCPLSWQWPTGPKPGTPTLAASAAFDRPLRPALVMTLATARAGGRSRWRGGAKPRIGILGWW